MKMASGPVPTVKETQQVSAINVPTDHRSFLPVQIRPNAPPFIKQHTRFDYINEYVGFEKDRYKNVGKAVFCFAFGVLTLQAFPPGGLVMIAMAARYQDIAWMDGFITKNFGRYRSIIKVD